MIICSAVFCACSAVSALTGKKVCKHFRKKADVAGAGRVEPMNECETRIIYIVRDMLDSRRIINVLDADKNLIYTFEKVKSKCKCKCCCCCCCFKKCCCCYKCCCCCKKKKQVWKLISGYRAHVGTVFIEKCKYWIEFPHREDMLHRAVKKQKCIGSKYQHFKSCEEDKARFRWYRTSFALDRVTAMEDPRHECKQRVAHAYKLFAPKKCKLKKKKIYMENLFVDYQIKYDHTLIDRELLITTAFISIMTQWKKSKKTYCPENEKKKFKKRKVVPVIKVKRLVHKTKTTAGAVSRKLKVAKCMGLKLGKKKDMHPFNYMPHGGELPPPYQALMRGEAAYRHHPHEHVRSPSIHSELGRSARAPSPGYARSHYLPEYMPFSGSRR